VAFILPTFNLSVKLWRRPNLYAMAPDRTFMANLSPGRRVMRINSAGTVTVSSYSAIMQLLCPKGTDIIGVPGVLAMDLVEVPAGTGRVYWVSNVDDVARGFANEYRLAHLMMINGTTQALTGNPWAAPLWPIPYP